MAAYCRPRVVSALLALCCLMLPSIARAQCHTSDTPPKGRREGLYGVVRDPSGQVAAHITVTIENEATGQQCETVSTGLGTYLVWGLPTGSYTVIAASERFGLTMITGVEVLAEKKTALDIKLGEGHRERVSVQSRAADQRIVQRDGSIGASFGLESLESETRPLSNGRTLQSMLAVVPGVVFTDSTGTLAQFTAGGQRRFENRLTIDGANADLALDLTGPGIGQADSGALPAYGATGGTQTLVPLASIEGIKISTTNAAPESAKAPGAQMVIVTRAGGDRLTGTAFTNVRPSRLQASDWFANAGRMPERSTRYRDFGVSLGGPVLPHRISYYAAWERQDIDRPISTTIPVPSRSTREAASAAARRVLDAFPQPNGQELGKGLAEYTAQFPSPSNLASLSVRVDGSLTASHRVFSRFNSGVSDGDEISPDLRVPRLTFSHREKTRTRTGTVGLTSALSSSTANELRANVSEHRGSVFASPAAYGDAGSLPSDILVPGSLPDAWTLVIVPLSPDAPSAGTLMSGRTAASRQRQFQIGDTFTVATSRHEWRLGFDFTRVTSSSAPTPDRYTYRFLSLSDLRARVIVERIAEIRARRESWSLFAQDVYRVSPRLSLNYGVRYDVQPAPTSLTGVQPTLMQFDALPVLQARDDVEPWWRTSRTMGPQAAASYLLGPAGRETNLHAGWSLTFAPLTNPGATPLRGRPYVTSRTTPITALPVAESLLAAPTNRGDYYSFPEDLRRPRTHDWYVGIDQALPGSQRLSLAYVGAAGLDLIYWHSYDVGAERVHAYSNDATSDYHSLLLQYVRRMSKRWQAQLAYTWSHAIDTDSGESLGPHPPPALISPETNRGPADFDRRHVLYTLVSYRPPAGRLPNLLRLLCSEWQFDVVGTLRSGAPFSVTDLAQLESGAYRLRLDLVSDATVWTHDDTAPGGRRISPDAFRTPEQGRQGTLGRNRLRGSPLRQVDLALSRFVRLGRVTGQFRVDAFNVFNVPNFGAAESRVTFPSFGEAYRSYADALGTGTLTRGGLTPIQQVGGARSIQLGLRLSM